MFATIIVVALFSIYSGAQAQTSTSTILPMCPVGYTCTLIPPQPQGCPAGYMCTLTVPPVNSCYQFNTNLGIGSTGTDVVALQTFLISNGYDIPEISNGSTAKGNFASSTAMALMKYQTANGIEATGYFGPLTRAKVNASCTNTIVIYPKGGENMVGGDPMLIGWTPSIPVSVIEIVSTAGNYSFGIYGPKYGNYLPITAGSFTYKVLSTTPGGMYFVRLTPANGGAQITSKIFSINTINQSSITVLSPNGGETWQIGTVQNIKWSAPTNMVATYVNIGLLPLSYTCPVGQTCPTPAPILIENNVSIDAHAYSWPVGQVSGGVIVPDGSYSIRICPSTGTSNCDTSDSAFIISSAIATTTGVVTVSLDALSPVSATLQTPQSNITFAVIDLKAGNYPVTNMNGIQIASNSSNASVLSNIKVYDGSTLLGTVPSLVNNGSYWYQWINVSNVIIPANATKSLRITADVSSTVVSTSTSVRLGIAGLNFSAPGAYVSGLPIYGSGMYLVPTYPVTPTVSISNTSTALGVGIPDTANGPIMRYPVTFNFTLTAGSYPIYLGTVPAHSNALVFDGTSGSIIPSVDILSVQNPVAGDTPDALIIPPEASRTFTYQGIIRNPGATGSYRTRIIGIQYGTSPNYLNANTITSGLENLSVMTMFVGGTVTPTINSFTISPIVRGGTATLSWKTTGIQSCTLESLSTTQLNTILGSYMGVVKGSNDSITFSIPPSNVNVGIRNSGTTGNAQIGCYTGPNLTGTYVGYKTVQVVIPSGISTTPATTTSITAAIWDAIREYFAAGGR